MTSVMNENVKAQRNETLTACIRRMIYDNRVIVAIAGLFSVLLGEEVATRRAYQVVHASVVFVAMIGCSGSHLGVTALLLVWFAAIVWQLRQD